MKRPLRFGITPALKAIALSSLAVFVFAIVATGGCSSSSTPATSPTNPVIVPSRTPGPSPSPTATAVVFVALDYASIPPTADPTYGKVTGYAGLPTPLPSPLPTISSQIITVHCNQTIQFFNLDRLGSHTASNLGPAAGPSWPPVFNNVNGAGVGSPLLTPITTSEFSTGTLLPLGSFSTSFVYSTGSAAGSFDFGDYFDYTPNDPTAPKMRTVITVLCP